MNARDWIYERLTGALIDPERASAELDAYRAEVLNEAAEWFDKYDMDSAYYLRCMARRAIE